MNIITTSDLTTTNKFSNSFQNKLCCNLRILDFDLTEKLIDRVIIIITPAYINVYIYILLAVFTGGYEIETRRTKETCFSVSLKIWLVYYLWFSEFDIRGRQEPCDVMLHVLKDEVNATGQPRSNQALKLYYIGMIKASQNQYLTRHEPHTLRFEIVEPHLLQCHYLPRLKLPRPKHTAIRSLPYLSKSTTSNRLLHHHHHLNNNTYY